MSDVMEIAGDLLKKTGDAAYVRFYTEAKHLRRKSEEAGHYVAIDVDMVEVIQKGARDGVKFEVPRWLQQNKAEVAGGRMPPEHAAHYERMYQLWKSGQEMPVEGTPIKGWAVISPAQAETIVYAGIRTVEDLAKMNAEAMSRIGMGAVMLKNKAQAWIAQANDKGPLTMEMAELKRQNDLLKLQLEAQGAQIAELQQTRQRPEPASVPETPQDVIAVSEILDPLPTPKRTPRVKEPYRP